MIAGCLSRNYGMELDEGVMVLSFETWELKY